MNEDDTFNKLKKYTFDQVDNMVLTNNVISLDELTNLLQNAGWTLTEYADALESKIDTTNDMHLWEDD